MGRTLLLRLAVAALLLLVLAPAAAADRTIVVLGDSLSAAYGMDRDQGWVALLNERLRANDLPWEAVNASTSGDTTRTALSRLDSALEQHAPGIVIVALGGNDGLRGISPGEIERNLGRIVTTVREHGARVLLAGVRIPPNYGRAYTERFTEAFTNVATEYDVPLVPRILADVAGRSELMQDDGIHPRAEAQPRILDNIWSKLRPMLAE